MLSRLARFSYLISQFICRAFSWALCQIWRPSRVPGSVLHISYMVHIPFETVTLLREAGVRAEYLAVGKSSVWSRCDRQYLPTRIPFLRAFQELFWMWSYVSRFEIIHSHFMVGLSDDGWEWPILKRLGVKLVVHFRGCDIRNRTENMRLAPRYNICENCDYNYVCETPIRVRRRELARRYSDLRLVTTPDLLDFDRGAVYFPFFSPILRIDSPGVQSRMDTEIFKIVHVTNHPGIEGTYEIQRVVEELKSEGLKIDFIFLRDVGLDRVKAELATADLSIGKMKMGFYANAQIESLALGVPAVTYVRPEFITSDIIESGLILSDLHSLKADLRDYVTNPSKLRSKRNLCVNSVNRLHSNSHLIRILSKEYMKLNGSLY